MKHYLIRSVKYLIWLTLLFVIIFLLMIATGTSREGAQASFSALFTSNRGIMMLLAILVLALLYPRFGFTRRTIAANLTTQRSEIMEVFERSGFALVDETENQLTFRAITPFKKAILLWEDTITVTPSEGGGIYIEGIRKEVVKIEFRLNGRLS